MCSWKQCPWAQGWNNWHLGNWLKFQCRHLKHAHSCYLKFWGLEIITCHFSPGFCCGCMACPGCCLCPRCWAAGPPAPSACLCSEPEGCELGVGGLGAAGLPRGACQGQRRWMWKQLPGAAQGLPRDKAARLSLLRSSDHLEANYELTGSGQTD